jgi:hypothetical protein
MIVILMFHCSFALCEVDVVYIVWSVFCIHAVNNSERSISFSMLEYCSQDAARPHQYLMLDSSYCRCGQLGITDKHEACVI